MKKSHPKTRVAEPDHGKIRLGTRPGRFKPAEPLPETRKPSLASRNESTETLFSQFKRRAITSYHDGRSKMPAMRRRNRNRIIFLPLLRRTTRPSHGPTRGTDGTANGTDYGTRLWHILCSRKTCPAV